MGLFESIFGKKKQASGNEFEQLANMISGAGSSDPTYQLESSIASLLDALSQDDLDTATIILKKDNQLSALMGDYSGNDSDVIGHAKVCKTEGIIVSTLKKSVGKRDNISYFNVDQAAIAIRKALGV